MLVSKKNTTNEDSDQDESVVLNQVSDKIDKMRKRFEKRELIMYGEMPFEMTTDHKIYMQCLFYN